MDSEKKEDLIVLINIYNKFMDNTKEPDYMNTAEYMLSTF